MSAILGNPAYAAVAFAWAGFLLYWIISSPGKGLRGKIPSLLLTTTLLPAVVGLFLFIGAGAIPDGLNPILWRRTVTIGLCADVVALASVLLLIWARRTLGANWSHNVRGERATEIVRSGPYGHVRHPIYTGFIGLVLGTAIAYGRLLGVVILAASIAGLYVKSCREDAILAVKFKNEYPGYKAKTKALFPYIL
jgi:protein-S-isoprenylcysteine O-methyltransferase Ste14